MRKHLVTVLAIAAAMAYTASHATDVIPHMKITQNDGKVAMICDITSLKYKSNLTTETVFGTCAKVPAAHIPLPQGIRLKVVQTNQNGYTAGCEILNIRYEASYLFTVAAQNCAMDGAFANGFEHS